ncbi:type II toxin-antitoxin system RelE/ParE family toxin [Aphanothece sacrum]|uniref:Phage-related protein n=1 Tax=Aphanothece sacrum FPU1 TaxID=1920663 RepID=A0A401IHM7_APHSA|nr:type II toxin-antitoxin system RelE/ParE family toxin [Aphanothece sacrum]GBF80651.1 hypothetical protein AsFPU1_2055 [Aphanothece sacrum FPU1]GBF83145.1 hypothetical protein AsFPU3_0184 [Aphanothece sacrum FPU3]
MGHKPIYWIGTSRNDISNFSEEARRKAGFQLRVIQKGDKANDFKPIPIIGKGTEEIRIWTGETYRIFYVARFEEGIYVLHAFRKKTQRTSKKDIELGQQRYQQMIQFRQQLQE